MFWDPQAAVAAALQREIENGNITPGQGAHDWVTPDVIQQAQNTTTQHEQNAAAYEDFIKSATVGSFYTGQKSDPIGLYPTSAAPLTPEHKNALAALYGPNYNDMLLTDVDKRDLGTMLNLQAGLGAKDIDYDKPGSVAEYYGFSANPDSPFYIFGDKYLGRLQKNYSDGVRSGGVAGIVDYMTGASPAFGQFLQTGDPGNLSAQQAINLYDAAIRQQGEIQQTKGPGILGSILGTALPVVGGLLGGPVGGFIGGAAGGLANGGNVALGALGGVLGAGGGPFEAGIGNEVLRGGVGAAGLLGAGGNVPAAGDPGSPSSSAQGPTVAPYGDNPTPPATTGGNPYPPGTSAAIAWAIANGGGSGGTSSGGSGASTGGGTGGNTGGSGSGTGGTGGSSGGGGNSGSGGGSGGLPDISSGPMDVFTEGGLFGGRYVGQNYLRPIESLRYFDATTNPFLMGRL